MDLLRQQESDKYRAVWGNKRYREFSPGERHVADAIEWMTPEPGATFTDWGCGTGRASDFIYRKGYKPRLVDIAKNAYLGELPFVEACLWSLPDDLGATDYGFCADVMEHIPTDNVDAVFAGIAARTRVKCYFQIALFHDSQFTGNGPLHLSVFPPEWWQEKISRHFKTAEYRNVKRKHVLAVATP
jgi:SAM-dependent methyltransferase